MSIDAVSVVDGRYERHISQLKHYASEQGLIRYRVQVEVEWFLYLHKHCSAIVPRTLNEDEQQQIERSIEILIPKTPIKSLS